MSKKITILNCGVYPYDVLFCVGSTEKEVTSYLKNRCKYELDDEEISFLQFKNRGGRTVRLRNGAIVLWVRSEYIPIVAHEVFHTVELVMEKIKSPLNEQTSEPYAYFIEYLFKQTVIFLKK